MQSAGVKANIQNATYTRPCIYSPAWRNGRVRQLNWKQDYGQYQKVNNCINISSSRTFKSCKIGDFHGDDYEECYLLRCGAV
jgi:hypothetical protein